MSHSFVTLMSFQCLIILTFQFFSCNNFTNSVLLYHVLKVDIFSSSFLYIQFNSLPVIFCISPLPMFPKSILFFLNVKITKILVLNKWQMTKDSYSRAERKWQTEKVRFLRQITSVRGKMAKGSCWRTDDYKRIIGDRTTVVEEKFMKEKWSLFDHFSLEEQRWWKTVVGEKTSFGGHMVKDNWWR